VARPPDGVTRYEHPRLGFSIELADGWEVASEVPPIFLAPGAREQAFAPNVGVTSGRGEPLDEQLEATVAALDNARLIDREPLPEGVTRILVHHVVRLHAVALEQWWFAARDELWVASASCAAIEYDERATALGTVAASLVPPR
jgi:hypothetical protein